MFFCDPQLEARKEIARRGGERLLKASPGRGIVAARQVAQAQIAARERVVGVAGQQSVQDGGGRGKAMGRTL